MNEDWIELARQEFNRRWQEENRARYLWPQVEMRDELGQDVRSQHADA